MRQQITIKNIGDLEVKPPRSCVAYDLISTWSAEPSRSHIGRLAAAAVGACGQDRRFPKYDSDQARPIAYGGVMMDHLLSRGALPSDILEAGMLLLSEMAPLLLRETEVKKKSDGSELPPDELRGSGS